LKIKIRKDVPIYRVDTVLGR